MKDCSLKEIANSQGRVFCSKIAQRRVFVVAGFALGLLSGAHAQNIVQNPTFSDPSISSTDFPDWTVGPDGVPGTYTGLDLGPDVGLTTNWITLSPFSSEGNGTISQVLNTTPGDTYTLTWWAATDDNADGISLRQLWWNGSLADDFSGSAITLFDAYQEFSVDVTATSNTTTLEFLGYQNDGWWDVNSVSAVQKGSPVPGPAAIAPFGAGLLAALRRRRKS